MGDRLLVLVNVTSVNFLGWAAPGEGWVPAAGSTVVDGHNTAELRGPVFNPLSKTAQLYSLPWAGGNTSQPVKQVAGRTIERLGISEDGSEVIIGLGPFGSGSGAMYPYASCEFQYLDGGTYAMKNTFATGTHVCRENNHAGSFSAVIAGWDQGAGRHQSHSRAVRPRNPGSGSSKLLSSSREMTGLGRVVALGRAIFHQQLARSNPPQEPHHQLRDQQ